MNNVSCNILNLTSKKGNPYQCLEFCLKTTMGDFKSRAYPTELEMSAIKKALSDQKGLGAIYSGQEDNSL